MNYYQLYRQIALPASWTEKLFQVARDCGVTLFSSPFDERAVELLRSLDCPAYKIASFEICDDPLLQAVAATGRLTATAAVLITSWRASPTSKKRSASCAVPVAATSRSSIASRNIPRTSRT